MFERHVTGRLAALVDGQLTAAETARANAHLAKCARCRAARDRFHVARATVGRLPRAEAPASVWASIESAIAADAVEVRRGGRWQPLMPRLMARQAFALAAVLVLATIAMVLWQGERRRAGSDVVRLDGTGGQTRMAVGEWVQTDASSRARIRIGDIGTVDVAPGTRMQLVASGSDAHRLNLAHGSISAVIVAPPRLFFVETPSSTVVDLGCAYTMQVDEAGVGLLRVTSGWASLEWSGRESLVPAGASSPTRPRVGPGTPYFDDASGRLRQALLDFDFDNGGSGALNVVLTEARDRDTLTLWHLLSRVEPPARARIFDRMVELTPLPRGVTREQALALDGETLRKWREELAWTW
jgi:putative zinc finger protein/FecR-like protein